MASVSDWKVPSSVQPKAEDYSYDLDLALACMVSLRATVPADAFTAETLGTERAGNGVIIRGNGLVLTIGYLITEADTIWLTLGDGRSVPGHVLGYDQETGFGLVQALAKLDMPALEFGQSAAASLGERVVVAGAGGRQHSVAARIVAKQEFAGYWEYVLDEAIFTAPAHPNWGGTALIGPAGDLLGIGSLQLQHSVEKGAAQNINMIVPIDLLKPIFDDLLKFGRRNAPSRPWLGFYATEVENRLGCRRARRSRTGQARRPAHRRHRAQGRRHRGPRSGEHVPPHLGARPGRRRSADHRLSRRRDHGSARQVERARSLPQGTEFALSARRPSR
jgi:S1-C subfamily serine protease